MYVQKNICNIGNITYVILYYYIYINICNLYVITYKMHINYIFEILCHRAHCTLLYQLQLQSIHIYIQCQRHPTAYSIGILTTTTLELKSWARFQLRCTLRWQYPELVVYRMYSPHYALPTRRRHRNRTQDWIQHGLPIYMGDSDFNA